MSLESLRDMLRAINLTKLRGVIPMAVDVTIEAKTLTVTIGGETHHLSCRWI